MAALTGSVSTELPRTSENDKNSSKAEGITGMADRFIKTGIVTGKWIG